MSGLLPSDTDSTAGNDAGSGPVEGSDGDRSSVADGAADRGAAPSDAPDGTAGDDVRVCWLDDEDADELIGSLSSETARSVLTALHEERRTASELATVVDTSVQNVRHHLSNLQEAGLVAVAGTRYSVKGREMTVYAPADERLVVAVGGDGDRTSLLDSLRGLLGVAALLGGASLLVQWAFGAGVVDLGGPATAPRVGDSMAGSAGAALGVLPPGLGFLCGGLLVLATVLAADRLRGP
ncbi:ArsR/SmtB family transcription factor [Halorarum salinum]|uniref:Winged helix-turn-helix transcriptional regulator n=1 Tax=Halorarum salinum TaxID=2743089 RepID=A0A7D5QK31_9EURY|nr:winged helix-turn-helix domain-containing protein [Halobaculum salinum]QLG61825.1 winged helix-turn-helix transcriptional regulator [Halobaculum salinum]